MILALGKRFKYLSVINNFFGVIMGPKVRIWIFIFLSGLACPAFSQQFIKTDASGGIFNKDQILSFELTAPGWLRILINDREIYRGSGPAFQELGVPQGEERGFTLNAEYFSPGGEMAESLSWYIYIDKKAPPLPALEFRNTHDGLRLTQAGGEANAKIRAIADMDGEIVFFPGLEDPRELPRDSFPSDSFQALIWAEDMAGNFSEFRSQVFDLSMLRMDNPLPGEWLNRQMLIIAGAEGKSVYWSDDGSHPLEAGGSGRLYRGPIRIERDGRVHVRIAWRETDGRTREDAVVYTVAPKAGGAAENLDSLARAEEAVIASQVNLQLPSDWLWSIGNTPRAQPESIVTLRPERLIKRTAAIQLSAPDAPGIYRFAYFLDGGGSAAERQSVIRHEPLGETYLYPAEGRDAFPPVRLVYAGRSRVIVWPEVSGNLYYSWGGVWHEAKGPLPVPLNGGNLRWFVLDREIRLDEIPAGPYSMDIIPAQMGTRETSAGRIAYRDYGENTNWKYASPLIEFFPGMIMRPGPDVCSGEDLVWAFISSGGKVLEQQRRDRLSPPLPVIEGIPEYGWTRGSVMLNLVKNEAGDNGVIEAVIRYVSGTTAQSSGSLSLKLDSALGERAEVAVEAYLVDSQGNIGPKARRHFSIDPKTIYVSAEPLVERSSGSGIGMAGSAAAGATGDLDNPFVLLKDAISYAAARGIADIRIAGSQELSGPVAVTRDLHIEGGWQMDAGNAAKASVTLGNDFSWNLRPGSILTLNNLYLERQRGSEPLIRAGRNSKVEIKGTDIVSQGPLLTMDNGVCIINNSAIKAVIPGEQRIAVIAAGNTLTDISGSRFELEGNYGLILDLRGGTLSARESGFFAARGKTASLIVLNGTLGNLNGLTLQANAADYASSLEAAGSEVIISGGRFEVSARDTNAVLFENCAAAIFGTQFHVNGSFSAKAAEIRGPFPVVQNCRFYFSGSAARSEIFSGSDVPKAGNITGNSFSGFTHIWGPGWPIERLSAFNHDFAPHDKPNTVSLRP